MSIHQYIIDGDPASLGERESAFDDDLAPMILPPGLELDPLGRGPLEPDDSLPFGLIATHNPKPLPIRAFDWEVIHEATYDGAEDSPTRHQIGFGATLKAACDDLQAQLDEQEVAPLVDDVEREDLAFHRGNDWMTDTDRMEDVCGVRGLFR